MIKVDIYGDVYDDGLPDDVDLFNDWLDNIEARLIGETDEQKKETDNDTGR